MDVFEPFEFSVAELSATKCTHISVAVDTIPIDMEHDTADSTNIGYACVVA
uniref:Pheromone n=1 Tax=Lentinula edodes TaxID=5353 RepID=G8CR02_LENED|nr:pheromone precursor [Lentinula edodes]AGC14654.1 pheromone precursor [Lentinula edodes]AGC14665.1 pheromone precursor [Lentinula edodes]AGL07752.1 pheromone precursor [Lentinula edodes]AWT58011.1 Pheromone [Lentinula edodes]